jgi:hypothetical protein
VYALWIFESVVIALFFRFLGELFGDVILLFSLFVFWTSLWRASNRIFGFLVRIGQEVLHAADESPLCFCGCLWTYAASPSLFRQEILVIRINPAFWRVAAFNPSLHSLGLGACWPRSIGETGFFVIFVAKNVVEGLWISSSFGTLSHRCRLWTFWLVLIELT